MPLDFSLARKRLGSMPMCLALVPLVAGILFDGWFELPLWLLAAGFAAGCLCMYLCRSRPVALLYAAASLFALGAMLPALHEVRSTVPYGRSLTMAVDVDTEPRPREGYSAARGRIAAWSEGGGVMTADERVVLWLRCDSVAAGDRLTVVAPLRERISRHADYARSMRRRGYVGALSLSEADIVARCGDATSTLQRRAVERLRATGIEGRGGAVVQAMATGSRDALDEELKRMYSRSGTAHVLAVSGLHLGLVAAAVDMLLAWLALFHGGHILRKILGVAAIWLFAAMCGLPASVVRAAVMFSIFQLSRIFSSSYVSLNALSATAFVMLVFDSSYLWDTGFRLSMLAVTGILLWGVPLARRLRIGYRAVDAILSTVAVGVAATLWTMPVISHEFGYMAWSGIVVSPAIMVSAAVVVVAALTAVVMPAGWAAAAPAIAASFAAEAQNAVVRWAAAWGVAEWRMGAGAVFAVYALFAAITLLCWSADRKKRVTLPRYDDYVRS